jgi:peptide/nickel transport system permease protein
MSVGAAELLPGTGGRMDLPDLAGPADPVAARSTITPLQLFWRRFRRDRLALVSLGFIVLLIVVAIAAPLVVSLLGLPGPNVQNPNLTNAFGSPLGPSSAHPFGVDQLGQDVASRVIYGTRVSLIVGIVGTALATVLGTIVGLLAGYYRGWTDTVISRTMDVVWAFPVMLLAIALGLVLAVGGLQIGPLHLSGGSIWIPILIIGGVSVPYIARPLRGQVLSLREKEFVEAAVAQGAGPLRIMFGELLPNLSSTIIVFFTLTIANNMLLEAALSFLGVGVQPPETSWGTMIAGGFELLTSSPLLTIIPGTMILLTVLSINVFGDGLRDALDPNSKLRLEAHAGIAEPEGTAV